ncbi:MAG: V-type ATP synthase subunit E [Caldisphaera sp.]|nr:V-type ATP synthase subunit E [Caldisphaera sp.]
MPSSGNPKKVAEEIIERKLPESMKVIDDAYNASLKLLNDSYQEALNELQKGINEKYQEISELLKSAEASLQLDVRKKVSERRNQIINNAFKEALDSIKSQKNEEWYVNFMKKVIEAISTEAESYGGLILYVSNDDINLAKKISAQYKNIEVSKESINIIGGVIAMSGDGSTKIDYSIDQIIRENEVFLKGVAFEKLFGGR